jgi:DNA (cytosine-5)-methyltransferase 1
VHAVLGGELAFTADTDPGASAVLARRFPGVPNLGDIKNVDWVSLGAVDILAGGYPCTPFSQAGKRLGAADERHVWPHFVTAISRLRPGMVILENVQGHLTLGFDVVLADLAALGYDAEWVVVTASAAGAPHRRARLFVMAFPAGMRAVAGVPVAVISDGAWTEPRESLFGVLPFAGRIPPSGRMAGGRVYAAPDGPTELYAGLLKTPTAQLAVNGGSQHPDKRRAGGHGPTLADQVEHELLPTPAARDGKGRDMPGRAGGKSLPETLLPTPRAADGNGNGVSAQGREGSPSLAGMLLPTPNATDWKGGNEPLGRERDGRPRTIGDADLPAAVALLPTPRATGGTKGGPNQRGLSGDLMLPSAVMDLLPTPTVADSRNSRNSTAGRSPGSAGHAGTTLSDVFWDGGALLPTPSAGNFNDGEDLASWEARRQRNLAKGIDGNGQGTPLPVAAQQIAGAVDWGPYEAAIRRWEAVLGRPAPRPTVPGKTGERLNPELPEFMMGLPSGWITDVPGLSRNAQLKAAGNGVVPAQAELALRILLDRAGLTSLGRAA